MKRAFVSFLILTASSSAQALDLAQARVGEHAPAKEFINAGLEWISTGIEVAGVAIIVVGATAASVAFLWTGFRRGGWPEAFRSYRANLGRGILLGLELLVAADIIGTIAVRPSLANLFILGLIVLIRTFLSFSLEIEIEGQWPWRRASTERSEGPPQHRL